MKHEQSDEPECSSHSQLDLIDFQTLYSLPHVRKPPFETKRAMNNKRKRGTAAPRHDTAVSMRQTRLRSRLPNAPPLMNGLDYRNQATEQLPAEPEYISTQAVRLRLQTRIILRTQRPRIILRRRPIRIILHTGARSESGQPVMRPGGPPPGEGNVFPSIEQNTPSPSIVKEESPDARSSHPSENWSAPSPPRVKRRDTSPSSPDYGPGAELLASRAQAEAVANGTRLKVQDES